MAYEESQDGGGPEVEPHEEREEAIRPDALGRQHPVHFCSPPPPARPLGPGAVPAHGELQPDLVQIRLKGERNQRPTHIPRAASG